MAHALQTGCLLARQRDCETKKISSPIPIAAGSLWRNRKQLSRTAKVGHWPREKGAPKFSCVPYNWSEVEILGARFS